MSHPSTRWIVLTLAIAFVTRTRAEETAIERGYRLLTTKAYLPIEFDQTTLDEVWQVWPEPLRTTAQGATSAERRRMLFERYGLTSRPEDSTLPLQYVVDNIGNWSMNCFACHGGGLGESGYPGLPNNRFAMQTMVDELRKFKLQTGRQLSWLDQGSLLLPLSRRKGLTNASNFSVFLLNYRDADLIFHEDRVPVTMLHHDLDAPPLWHFRKKERLYADGYAAKTPRALMQFLMVRYNGPEKFHEWEIDFEDIFAYLESLQPPPYPRVIDTPLADAGRQVFERVCAECHGTYGDQPTYPNRVVPIEEVGTDRVRLDALANGHRERYAQNWLSYHGQRQTWTNPEGYIAPPLDGIWASAPYFHNGSVPTLWHVLHADNRPTIWRRSHAEFDYEQVGLSVTVHESLPESAKTPHERRDYFNSQRTGSDTRGHRFPESLEEDEKRAVLEYLKTL